MLTKDAVPQGNDGLDNCENDLIVAVNDTLLSPSGRRCALGRGGRPGGGREARSSSTAARGLHGVT